MPTTTNGKVNYCDKDYAVVMSWQGHQLGDNAPPCDSLATLDMYQHKNEFLNSHKSLLESSMLIWPSSFTTDQGELWKLYMTGRWASYQVPIMFL